MDGIQGVRDSSGVWKQDEKEIIEIFKSYLGDICGTLEEISERKMECRSILLNSINRMVSQDDARRCNAPFTTKELGQVVKGMARNKAPSPDGLPIEAYAAT